MATLERYDSLPWYRQFWPWFLIALPGSVVIAGFITLYIANEHADDLVADEYYKNGLAINRQLEKKNRAAELGITARLQLSGREITAHISGSVNANDLRLKLSHPLEADRDLAVPLIRMQPGVYIGSSESVMAGRWHWILENRDTPGWRLDGSVILDPADNAQLRDIQ